MLEHVQAIRYVTPLRESGSLPGIVEADDDGTYVVKFRGAALYLHHSWPNRGSDPARFASQPFDASKHVLRDVADDLGPLHEGLAAIVRAAPSNGVLAQVPDEWLEPMDAMPDPEAIRTAYRLSLLARLDNPSVWLAAPRSTVVQPGPVHGGLTSDPAAELQRLLIRLVG